MCVCNTSPLIHLSLVLPGGLAALAGLTGPVIVPREVRDELEVGGAKDDAWLEIRKVPGIECRESAVNLHPLLASQLDAGEAAVIQTARDEGIPTVILDERKARRIAKTMGLRVTGTLGILMLAKERGVLPSMRTALRTLRRHGIWLDAGLESAAIARAGE